MNYEDLFAHESGLRVAVVHSFYSSRQSSGENRAVEQQVAALKRSNSSVFVAAQRTDEREQGRVYPIEAAATVASGRGRSPLAHLGGFDPDVVHVHNLFPNYGRTWVDKWDGPLVATLHNYRPLCAAATFYREGRVCTDCLDQRSSRPAVRHACYRGSRSATLPVAAGVRFDKDPLLQRADRLIVLTKKMRDLYARAGVPHQRMIVQPNFTPGEPQAGQGGGSWLYVGRLTSEKGVLQLLAEWPSDRELVVVGDGELAAEARSLAGSRVTFLGQQPPERVEALMRDATGLVMPSRWFEGFPLVYCEAMAAGTPVMAWRPSSVADLVDEEGTGLVVERDLSTAIALAEDLFPTLRERCRAAYESRYSETAWARDVAQVYDEAIASAKERR